MLIPSSLSGTACRQELGWTVEPAVHAVPPRLLGSSHHPCCPACSWAASAWAPPRTSRPARSRYVHCLLAAASSSWCWTTAARRC